LHPTAASFTNPGTFAYKFPLKDIVKHGVNFYKPLLKKINKILAADQRVNDAIQTNVDLMQDFRNKAVVNSNLGQDKWADFYRL
jgi:hypothetical protein